MAGQPRKRALALELEQRTRAHFEDDEHTALDFVVEWQASGKTLRALAAEISEDARLDPELEPAAIGRYLRNAFDRGEVDARLAEARERAAFVLVEDALDDALELSDKDLAPVVRVRNDARFWTAERYARNQFGAQKGANVVVNIGTLHLDAMRQRSLEAGKEGAGVRPALARSSVLHSDTDEVGSAIASAIDVEHVVLSEEIVSA